MVSEIAIKCPSAQKQRLFRHHRGGTWSLAGCTLVFCCSVTLPCVSNLLCWFLGQQQFIPVTLAPPKSPMTALSHNEDPPNCVSFVTRVQRAITENPIILSSDFTRLCSTELPPECLAHKMLLCRAKTKGLSMRAAGHLTQNVSSFSRLCDGELDNTGTAHSSEACSGTKHTTSSILHQITILHVPPPSIGVLYESCAPFCYLLWA